MTNVTLTTEQAQQIEEALLPASVGCLITLERANQALATIRTKDLTDDEIMKINVDTAGIVPTCDRQFHFARAVLAAYKEKNK